MSEFTFASVVSSVVLEEKTVKDLRALCASYSLTKYSKAPKPTLLKMIAEYYNDNMMEMTAADLREVCKEKGFTGVAKTNKANLIKLLINQLDATATEVSKATAGIDEVDVAKVEEIDISSTTVNTTSTKKVDKKTVTVTSGVRKRTIDFEEGQSIWDIHQKLANEMNIPPHPLFTVNDIDAPNNIIIQEGDNIEFFKANGNKGTALIHP